MEQDRNMEQNQGKRQGCWGGSDIPRVLIAAPRSGSGKTLVTCGLLEILRRRGLTCVSFKCGPDYIDPLFHRYVLGVSGWNLDSFFLTPDQVKRLFAEKVKSGVSGGRVIGDVPADWAMGGVPADRAMGGVSGDRSMGGVPEDRTLGGFSGDRILDGGTKTADFAVIEGVMGYYDGLGGICTQASAYEIGQITETPVILVVDGSGSSLSLIPLIRGFLEYREDSRIAGVILNRTSRVVAERLRPLLEGMGVRFLGSIPVCEEARLESCHLGLTVPAEQEQLREKMEKWGRKLESCLDIEGILDLARGACSQAAENVKERSKLKTEASSIPAGNTIQQGDSIRQRNLIQQENSIRQRNLIQQENSIRQRNLIQQENSDRQVDSIRQENPSCTEVNSFRTEVATQFGRPISSARRIGIAMDEAFCFYYLENLELLEKNGWELVPFSPLRDSRLPENLFALLLGGGYPEVYARDLSENRAMRESVLEASKQIRILAECGGFLYLHRTLEGMDGERYPMVGLIDGDGYRTDHLSRFGYISLYDSAEGSEICRGHEFHYWDSTCPGGDWQARKPFSSRSWNCMHVSERLMAGFPHLYYLSHPQWILDFLEGGERRC